MPAHEVLVVGMGQMGSRYAQRFLGAGFAVTVWNRTIARAQTPGGAGARVATSLPEAVANTAVIVSALEHASALRETLLAPDVLRRFRSGQLVIDTSTVHPRDARSAAAVLAASGVRYVDAPVSGGTVGAEQGTLTIMVGADPDTFQLARPFLERLGRPHRVGPTGAGQIAKLVNQVIVAVTIGAVAEGLFLAERAGLDAVQLLSILQGGFADSRILREHGQRMVQRSFEPGAANRVFLKDLEAIRLLSEDLDAELPLTARARDAYIALVADGRGEHDHSAYFSYLESLNGTANAQG